MIWRKAWAESKARFLIAVVVMILTSVFVIGWQDADRVLFKGFPRALYMLFALVFGMGGLLREQELGTAGFTLALPVSRRRLSLVRAAAGLGELAALALVPIAVIVAATPFAAHAYSVEQAIAFPVRWLLGGSALFALAFLASAVLGGEYTAFVAALVVFFGETVTTQFIRLARPETARYLFTLQEVMSGIRPAMVMPAAILIAATLVLIGAALSWTEARDF
jgi:ABC-type transport system involved in multi-copper enzyme maturation permease subunit